MSRALVYHPTWAQEVQGSNCRFSLLFASTGASLVVAVAAWTAGGRRTDNWDDDGEGSHSACDCRLS